MYQSLCSVDWCIAFNVDFLIRAWDNVHWVLLCDRCFDDVLLLMVLYRQRESRLLLRFQVHVWLVSVFKSGTCGHWQSSLRQFLKVYLWYSRLFINNKKCWSYCHILPIGRCLCAKNFVVNEWYDLQLHAFVRDYCWFVDLVSIPAIPASMHSSLQTTQDYQVYESVSRYFVWVVV